jgi:DNA mismatch repair protein MutS
MCRQVPLGEEALVAWRVTERSGVTGSVPSVLHPGAADDAATGAVGEREDSQDLADLHLDTVIAALTEGREGYALPPLFRARLRDPDAVAYRHEVFRDLRDRSLRDDLERFSAALRRHRDGARRAEAIRHPLQRHRLHLDGATGYVGAAIELDEALTRATLRSRALRAVALSLRAYVSGAGFTALRDEARELQGRLAQVRYALHVLEDRVHVSRTGERRDYGADVERSLRRLGRGVQERRPHVAEARVELAPTEAAVLELVAQLHPEVFAAVEVFSARHARYVDESLLRFERELQFYLATLDATDRLEQRGLPCSLPELVAPGTGMVARDVFDLALALTREEGAPEIVPNDLELRPHERVLVVTGANQGGKTTFARAIGQLHHLAALGLPVPARHARLPLVDAVLTHFEGEEDLRTLQGKLHEELGRVRDLLGRATAQSIAIMNESFSSTSGDDALALGRATLERLLELGACTVYVTFVDELASFDGRVASMVAAVDPEDPATRTFKLLRQRADGRAHAVAIARAYGLTYEQLRGRLTS